MRGRGGRKPLIQFRTPDRALADDLDALAKRVGQPDVRGNRGALLAALLRRAIEGVADIEKQNELQAALGLYMDHWGELELVDRKPAGIGSTSAPAEG